MVLSKQAALPPAIISDQAFTDSGSQGKLLIP